MFQDKQVKEQKGQLIELSTINNRQNKENEKIEKIEGLFHKLKISFDDYQQLNIAKLLAEIKVDQLYRQTLLELKIILQHPENKRSYIWNKDYEINDENIKSFLTIHRKRKDDAVKNKSITKVVIGKNLEKIKLNPTRLEEIENKLNLLKTDIFNDKNMYAFNNYGFTPQELEIMKDNKIIEFRGPVGTEMFKYITDKTVTEVAKMILFNLDKKKKVLTIHDPVYAKKVLDFLEWLYYETVNGFVNPKICEKLIENNLPKKYSKAVYDLGLVQKEGKNYYKWVNPEKVPEKSDAILVIEKERELSGEYRKNRRERIANEKNNNDKGQTFILDISGPIPPKPNAQVELKIETLNSVLVDCVKEEKEALENILNQHPEFLRWQKLNNILNSI